MSKCFSAFKNTITTFQAALPSRCRQKKRKEHYDTFWLLSFPLNEGAKVYYIGLLYNMLLSSQSGPYISKFDSNTFCYVARMFCLDRTERK